MDVFINNKKQTINWIKFISKKSDDFVVSLAKPENMKKDCPVVTIPIQQIWKRDSRWKRIKAILRLNYQPDEYLIQKIAEEIFIEEFFGTIEDLAKPLFDLMVWHQNRKWELNNLSSEDQEKADALEAMTNLSRKRYWKYTSPDLNLRLVQKQPIIAPLVYPVVAKTPVRSIQYFVDVHSRFAFNSIRKSKHKYASDLISYLYELLIIQQKVVISLHSLIRIIDNARTDKLNSILIKSEIDASLNIDSIVTYLKSSIEKSITLIGYTFCIPKLEDKKEHKKRISALENGIPDTTKQQPYYHFIDEYISSKRLEELNRFRTGILHKKGISTIQPHSFYRDNEAYKKIIDVFHFLFDQHCKNSTILIASLALLTDELVKLDKPDFKLSDIPIESLTNELKMLLK